jgi:trehalose synthase
MHIKDYAPIVGNAVIDELELLAKKLRGKSIQFVNSTAVGGGVAEILNRMIPLLTDLGLNVRWDVIKGGEQFFEVTKKIHNALHGGDQHFSKQDFEVFMETSRKNIEEMNTDHDIVFIHDPQPIALIEKKRKNKWIWRCHVDVSKPNRQIWEFLEKFINKYNAAIFSAPNFSQKLDIRQFLIAPSIDPLSDKNKDIPQEIIEATLKKFDIVRDKPIITQISRFDRLKDPIGVIEAYKKVKEHYDCQLILAGGTAADDPEGFEVHKEVMEAAKGDDDIHILLIPHDDIVVNALQRASDIIVQKSLKEGFGLTISEALWKEKPVVASKVGGIPLQITHQYSGMFCHSVDGAAFAIKQILGSDAFSKKLGRNGKDHIKNNFLLTRHLKDYMLAFLSMYHTESLTQL